MRINGDDIDNTNYQSGREAGSAEGLWLHQVLCCTQSNESISLSSSKSYMRGEIGYVTEVNFVRK